MYDEHINNTHSYEQVSVSGGVGLTWCWHAQKSLRKRGINFISNPIDN